MRGNDAGETRREQRAVAARLDAAIEAKLKELGMAGEWRQHDVSALIDDGALMIGDGYRAKQE